MRYTATLFDNHHPSGVYKTVDFEAETLSGAKRKASQLLNHQSGKWNDAYDDYGVIAIKSSNVDPYVIHLTYTPDDKG